MPGISLGPRDEFLVIGAVRYARGRATYVVKETVDWVIAHWGDLSDNTRRVIARDVREECRHRRDTYPQRTTITRIDDPDWQRLLNHIKDNQ